MSTSMSSVRMAMSTKCFALENVHRFPRFSNIFTAIRQEIRDIEEGRMDKKENPLKVILFFFHVMVLCLQYIRAE